MNEGFGGRRGPRTGKQRVIEMLKGAKTKASNPYGFGGRKKVGPHAPKPVSLAPIKMKD